MSTHIIKIGQGWVDDMKCLKKDAELPTAAYDVTNSLLELSSLFDAVVPSYGSMPSLKKLTCFATGHTLNKKEQLSDWERRPLNASQVEYAVLDAYVPILIFDALKAQLVSALGTEKAEAWVLGHCRAAAL